MIRIPYGASDLQSMILENYFYQDRTNFLAKLEDWGSKYLVFLRPRRFGKSLFISTLHYYYGLEHKKNFESIFGNLYIGKNPTPNANNYLILRFNFKETNIAKDTNISDIFVAMVLAGVLNFMDNYIEYFKEEDRQEVFSQTKPEDILKTIFCLSVKRKIPRKIYILIDNYDYLVSDFLSFEKERFKVEGNGMGKFYESMKTATNEGVVDRIFITGVSPITMDSLTSGFNISDNISLNPVFHEMMGFTKEEVANILRQADIPETKLPQIMHDLTDWYDGYKFTLDAENHLYNPDMVLYFLKEYGIMQKYPYEMLDSNIMTDYRKLRNIFKIGGGEIEKFALLDELLNQGHINFRLTRIYNLEANFTQEDFLSLLFYMGMLTVKEMRNVRWQFEIPNYVIKKLYFEYFTSIFLEKTRFANTNRQIEDAIELLVFDGNPEPFFKIVEYVLQENHSNRDEMVYGEKHLQTLMIGLLFPFEAYFIHSEYEAKKKYPDIFLEKMADRPITYEIVLELKYVKKSNAEKMPEIISGVQAQLNGYMESERFSRPDVKGFYVVFLGGEIYEWKEFGTY